MPRLARAVVLMFFAIALHVWGVHSPDPQEPVYSVLASRALTALLVSPPLPLAPPLQIVSARPAKTFQRRITLQTTVLNVPALPGPPPSARSAAPSAALVAVGTSGRTTPAAVDTADVQRSAMPASVLAVKAGVEAPARAAVDAPPTTAGEAPLRSAADVSAPAEALLERRTPAPAMAMNRAATEATRTDAVALPPDRMEHGPRDLADDTKNQKETVLAVVHEYARALGRLDVGATKAVYPSLDARELRRAFHGLEEQKVHFASCELKISQSGDDANARCIGNATYRPKVGSRNGRFENREWVFSLARGGSGWQILEARSQ